MDIDHAEAEDIFFGSKPDNRHSVHSEPVGFSAAQLSHLTPFQDDDQIIDLNYGEARDVILGKTVVASDNERSVQCESASSARPIISLPYLTLF